MIPPDPRARPPLPLTRRIRDEIAEHGAMPFARFMDLALYDAEEGYYAAGPRRLGTSGDFYTASDAGRDFGRCMARQIAEIDGLIGPAEPFHVLEFGAGRGLLARDILDAMPQIDRSLASRLSYVMIDRSASMLRAARTRVPEARAVAPEDLDAAGCGCVIAVELFDALPVHRLRRRNGRLVEVLVDLAECGDLVECEGRPAAEVEAYAARYGAAQQEGTEADVAPQAGDLLATLTARLARGIVIVVDYGDRAAALYGPSRPRGSLLAYHRHGVHENYLERPGEQDLTAHVNFSCLEDRARDLGLDVLGLTTQDRFLVANGITDVFETPAGETGYRLPSSVKRRLQALQLIHPEGMGRTFKFLLLAKACYPTPRLRGLTDPFAPDRR